MFTGLVTEIGRIASVQPTGVVHKLHIQTSAKDLILGESIATDGVCLTVTDITGQGFKADVSPETLKKTTLGHKAVGAPVHLERALAVGDRLGGHWVSGHVDGLGKVVKSHAERDVWHLHIQAPHELAPYIAPKGSITVEGVSLTVNAVSDATFELMLVPYTLSATHLEQLRPGNLVNLETDILAKYVVRALAFAQSAAQVNGPAVTEQLLLRTGFHT